MSQEITSLAERDYHLEKQRERSDQMGATIAREAARKAARKAEASERRQAQRQSALDEAERQRAYEDEHGITAARERKSAEFEAEIERQQRSLDPAVVAADKEGRSARAIATERVRAVLTARAAEENTLEFKVEKLIQQVAAIERRLATPETVDDVV